MMDDNALQFLASQLGYRVPGLLASGFGFVLALVYLRRCRLAALLTMLATGVMATTSLGTAFAQFFLMQAHQDRGAADNFAQYAQLMGLVGIVGSVVHAGALVLLVIAVFARRRSEQP